MQSFRTIRDVLQRTTGNVLQDDKEYLVRSRLAPLAEHLGLQDLDALAARLNVGRCSDTLQQVVDRMTTHETSFFRDQVPFQLMSSSILPELIASLGPNRVIRIWSAACSTGQEPYSLAIKLHEYLRTRPEYRFEIIATDVAAGSIELARRGLYSDFEVRRGLSRQMQERYFERDSGGGWRVRDIIRANITFKVDNLMAPMVPRSYFDVIFCRNVLIYFDRDAKKRILDSLPAHFRGTNGYLVLGAAETTVGISERFVRPASGTFSIFKPAVPAPTRSS